MDAGAFTAPKSLLPNPAGRLAPAPGSRGRGLRRPPARPRFPSLTEDLPREALGAHAATQLPPAHTHLELQRGRVREGAAPLGHGRGPQRRSSAAAPRLPMMSQPRANPCAGRGRGWCAAQRGIGPGRGRGGAAARRDAG